MSSRARTFNNTVLGLALSAVLSLCAVLPAQSRILKDLYADMPDDLCPLLAHENRLDQIDFLESGMHGTVKNAFGLSATLQTLTDDYLLLQASSTSRVEMRLLPAGRDTLLCLVRTLTLPFPESDVHFFNADWDELPLKKYLPFPTVDDFVKPSASASKSAAREALQRRDVPYIAATLSPDEPTVTFTLCCDGGDPDLRALLQPFLAEQIAFRWNGKRFARQR